MTYITEDWKPVVGYEGLYEVSSHGRVRGVLACARHPKPRLRSSHKCRFGYWSLVLWKRGEGKRKLVHRLVAEAFLNETLGELQVNHIDGDKGNNHYRNLELVTAIQNSHHAVRTGLMHRGERTAAAKLTEAQVREIRAYPANTSPTWLGRKYGVSDTAISRIICNRTWKHVAL